MIRLLSAATTESVVFTRHRFRASVVEGFAKELRGSLSREALSGRRDAIRVLWETQGSLNDEDENSVGGSDRQRRHIREFTQYPMDTIPLTSLPFYQGRFFPLQSRRASCLHDTFRRATTVIARIRGR